MLCEIIFRMRVNTVEGESVVVSGNIPELGDWDPTNAHKLSTNEQFYPFWISSEPLSLLQNHAFEFKLVIMKSGRVLRWENLHANRIYKPQFPRVSIEGEEGDAKGKELILKQPRETNDNVCELNVQRFQVKGFDPYLKADISDSDSDGRSFGLFSAGSIDGEFLAKIPIPGQPQMASAKRIQAHLIPLTSPVIKEVNTEERKLDALIGGDECDGFDEPDDFGSKASFGRTPEPPPQRKRIAETAEALLLSDFRMGTPDSQQVTAASSQG